MNLKVLGCHGGTTPKHRPCSFLINDRVALDAGAVCAGLSLEEQRRVETVLVSHSHLDHIAELGMLVDNRCQQGGPTLEIAGVGAAVSALREHYFNDALWPDFTKIVLDGKPMVTFRELVPEQAHEIGGASVVPVMVNHTVDTSAFVVTVHDDTVVYSGDTGPTERLWEIVNGITNLRALMIEVSFPDDLAKLARESGHHTPASLEREFAKLRHPAELPVLLYHIKPVFESPTLRELARINARNVNVLQLDDELFF